MKENFVAPDYTIHRCFCGSYDVGGSIGTVYCYKCGLTLKRPGKLQNAIDAWNAIHEGIKIKSEVSDG